MFDFLPEGRRRVTDMEIHIHDDATGEVMTLAHWFAHHLPRKDQEAARIAVRFAMDAQFEYGAGVISRIDTQRTEAQQ